jgi:phage-related protein
MKSIRIHPAVEKELQKASTEVREEVATMLGLLAEGLSLGLPASRPMPSVSHGAHELRIRDRTGQWRVFYFTKMKSALLVFHAFKKNTRTTPGKEVATAKKRLQEMLP